MFSKFMKLWPVLGAAFVTTLPALGQVDPSNPSPTGPGIIWGPVTSTCTDCEGKEAACSSQTSVRADLASVQFTMSLGETKFSRASSLYHAEQLSSYLGSRPLRMAGLPPFYKSPKDIRDFYLQAPLTARRPFVLTYASENITPDFLKPGALTLDGEADCVSSVDPYTHSLRQIKTDDLFVDILPMSVGSQYLPPDIYNLVLKSSSPFALHPGFVIRTWHVEDAPVNLQAPNDFTNPTTANPVGLYVVYGEPGSNTTGAWEGGWVNIIQQARFGGAASKTKSWSYLQHPSTVDAWYSTQYSGLPSAGTPVEQTIINNYHYGSSSNLPTRTVSRASIDSTGALGPLIKTYQAVEVYAGAGGLDRLAYKIEGDASNNQTTKYSYYSNAANAETYGRLKWVYNPDGSFEYYKYSLNSVSTSGSAVKYTPSGNYKWDPSTATAAAPDPDAAQCIVETTTYLGANEIDIVTKTANVETAHRHETWNLSAVQPQHIEKIYSNSTDYLQQTTAYYPNSDPEYQANRIAWRELFDGTAEAYSYSNSITSPGSTIQVVKKGAGSSSGVTEGIVTTSVRNRRREITDEKVDYLSASGSLIPMSHWVGDTTDDFGRVTHKIWNGDTNDTESFAWDCCGLSSHTDRFGILTEYKRDDLKRVYNVKRTAGAHVMETKTAFSFSAATTSPSAPDLLVETSTTTGNPTGTAPLTRADRITKTYMSGTVASIATPSPGGTGTVTTSYASNYATDTSSPPAGGRKVTATYPDGGQEVTEYQVDGRLSSVTGSAVADESHTYQAFTDATSGQTGIEETSIKLTSSGATSESRNLYYDEAGRLMKVEYPTQLAASGQNDATSISYYLRGETGGKRGLRSSETDPDGTKKFFDYDIRGNLASATEWVPNSANPTTHFERTVAMTYDATAAATGFGVNFSGTGPAYRKTTLLNTATVSSSSTSSTSSTTIGVELDGGYGRTTSNQEYTRLTKVETKYLSAGSWTETRLEPDGTKTISTYTDGLLASIAHTDSGAATTLSGETYSYDSLGRRSSKIDQRTGTGGKVFYTYSDGGLVLSQLESTGRGKKFTFDVMGRKTAEIPTGSGGGASLGQESYFSYYPDGNLKATYGKENYQTFRKYDEQGRMTELRTYQSLSTALEPVDGSSGGNEVTTWNYDSVRGWLTAKRDAATQGADYSYTAAGRLKTRQWARTLPSTSTRVKTTYNYVYGILTGLEYNDGTPTIAYSYNVWGGIASVTRGGALDMGYTYDSNFRVLTEQPGPPPAPMPNYYPYMLTRKWDPLIRPAGYIVGTPSTANATSEVSYVYDGTGRLGTLTYQRTPGATTLPAMQTFTYGYNYTTSGSYHIAAATGGTTSEIPFSVSGPGYTASRSYETTRDVLHAVSNASSSTVLSSYTYGVNDLNQRSGVTQAGTAFSGTPDSLTWSYDDLGQLYASGSIAHNSTDSRYYAYDNIGNRRQSRTGTTTTTGGAITNYYSNSSGTISGGNSLNQYAKISGGLTAVPVYDADGNLIDDGDQWTYTWDAENRMIKAETKTSSTSSKQKWVFGYDYLDRMTVRARYNWDSGTSSWGSPETFSYLYDGWNRIASTVDYSLLRDEYIWGLDISGTMQGGGGVGGMLLWQGTTDAYVSGAHNYSYYPAYDGNGNITELMNGAGSVVAHWEYDPFGSVVRSSPSTTDWDAPVNHFGFGFSTKPQNPGTGLYYFGYRNYDPKQGRWLNNDPFGELGGVNLQCYLGNDGVNRSDYLGEYNVWGHNSLIDSAFPDISPQERDTFKQASADVDENSGTGTSPDETHQHAMKSPDETQQDAADGYDDFVADQLAKAIKAACKGDHSKGDLELGRGMHAIMDSFSPAHSGNQQWDGLHGASNLAKAAAHAAKELWPSSSARANSDQALRDYKDKYDKAKKKCKCKKKKK